MCGPAAPFIALAAAQAGTSIAGDISQRKAQRDESIAAQKRSISANAYNETIQNQQIAREREASARASEDARTDSARRQATAKVAAARGGVTGASVDALLQDLAFQEARLGEALAREQSIKESDFLLNREAQRRGLKNQLESFRPITPSLAPQIGAHILGAAKDSLVAIELTK